MVSVGRRLGQLLAEKGIRQADFARRLGERRQRVNSWISGATEISSDAVPTVAQALGVTICDLYGVEEGHAVKLSTGSGKTARAMALLAQAIENQPERIEVIVYGAGADKFVPTRADYDTRDVLSAWPSLSDEDRQSWLSFADAIRRLGEQQE